MNWGELRRSLLAPWCCVSIGVIGLAPIALIGAQPVVITRQPQSQTVVENSWVAIDIQATGGILGYSWYRNGAWLATGTNQLAFPLANTADAGSYHVVIDNYGLFVTSQVAVIQVQSAAPDATWLDRPFARVATEGSPLPGASFHTFANWSSPAASPLLTFRDGQLHFTAGTTAGARGLYRWKDGILSTLVFTNTARPEGGLFGDILFPSDEGAGELNFSAVGLGMYRLGSGGAAGAVSSSAPAPNRPGAFIGSPGSFGRRGPGVAFGALVVDAPGSANALGAGVYFHDGTGVTRVADDTTDLPGALTGYATRPSANAVNFDGSTIVFSTTAAFVSGAPGGFFKATPSGLLTKLADYTDNRPGGTLKFTGFGDIDVDGEYIFAVANNTVWRFMPDGSVTNVAAGNFVSAAGPRAAYYGNTTFLRRWNDGLIQLALQIGRVVEAKPISQILAADGQGDDVAVLLKFTDLSQGIYVVSGPVPAVPVITREPMDATVIENATARFSVSAAGAPPLRYQWRKDGADLAVATNAFLELPQVSAADEGNYSVVIANDGGTVTSREAALTTVIPARPVICAQPTSSALYFGSNATFSVVASGLAPLQYQWFKRVESVDTPIADATGASLTLGNLGTSDKATYYVVVRNAHGDATSSTVTISSLLPWIVAPPTPAAGVVGGPASLQVAVLGTPPITYQWFKYPVPITTLPDQTNATLAFNNLSLSQAGPYAVRVTTPDGSLFTPTAALTVHASPPTPPVLGQPMIVSGQFIFSLPTENAFTYQIQSKANLEDSEWLVEQTLTGDGTVRTISVAAGGLRRFFRVTVLP